MVTVPVFGFGISPRGPRTLPRRPTDFIMSGVAISGIEVGPVFLLDLLDHLLAAHEIRACGFGLANFFAGRNHQNFLRLAQPVRQNDRAAHHLVRVLRIDAQPQRHFDGFVELREFHFLQKWQPLPAAYMAALSTCLRAFSIFFPDFFMFLLVSHRSLRLRFDQSPWFRV